MDNLLVEKLKTQWKKIREKMSTFDAYFSKGCELYEATKYSMALEFFKIALRQTNAETYAYYNLALTYQKLKKNDDAVTYYEKFLEYYPEDQSALYNVALIYFEKEDYKHAANYFYKSFRQKQDEKNIIALTKTYLKMDKMNKVLDMIDYIYNSPTCDNKYAFQVAKLIESQNQTILNPERLDYSIIIYKRLLDDNPKDIEVILAISMAFAKKGEWTNSITYGDKALAINPRSFEANNQLGFAYYCAENFSKSLDYYKVAYQVNSKTDYSIYSNMAYAYEKMGKKEEAIKMFKELITKFQDFPTKEEIKKHTQELVKSLNEE